MMQMGMMPMPNVSLFVVCHIEMINFIILLPDDASNNQKSHYPKRTSH